MSDYKIDSEKQLEDFMSKMSRREMLDHLEKIKAWTPETDIYLKVKEAMLYTAREMIQKEAES